MPPLSLSGNTLGQKRRQYNTILEETIKCNQKTPCEQINFEEYDIDNIFKIDIASHYRNVEYILQVLKCEDMLYVSRAIKRSTWLITDPQYSHIINPQYMYSVLFPEMTSKAKNKLLLHTRLHLKNENRVEQFYDYYKERDLGIALKWLPNCSVEFINIEVENNAHDISVSLLKRLCEKSFSILETFVKKYTYGQQPYFKSTSYFMNTDLEKYLNILESGSKYDIPDLKRKYTKMIMKAAPQRLIDNFEKYANKVDLKTFIKYLKKDEIKEFVLKQCENNDNNYWLGYDNLKLFMMRMRKEDRFNFIAEILKIKSHVKKESELNADDDKILKLCQLVERNSTIKTYHWYALAPFEIALNELKSIIRTEAPPEERNNILAVLLISSRGNLLRVKEILTYYRNKHINEAFKFKNNFVNNIITQTETHRFDNDTWKILDEIFHSLEVYIESDNNVQTCLHSIIIYNILHRQNVPEIVENKFVFCSLKQYLKKTNNEDKELVFDYLHTVIQKKINSIKVNHEAELEELIKLLNNAFELFTDYQKDIADYPWILDKIKDIILIKKEMSLNSSVASLYNKNKSWRKYMFHESLLVNPTEEVCLNILKHDASLLFRHKSEFEALTCSNTITLHKFLTKIRIFWAESLATELKTFYGQHLDQSGSLHKPAILGLCSLLMKKEFYDLIEKYKPDESQIKWGDTDKLILSLRKNIARHMYLARPQPKLETVLFYSIGDYLQFALPSINAIFHNLSITESRKFMPHLVDTPVSLQKHGIRLLCDKLETNEIRNIFSEIWKDTKNSSIRSAIFQQTYRVLCAKKQLPATKEIWNVLEKFIEDLSCDEDKMIYTTLSKVDDVPLKFRGKYCMRSYKILKSLPTKVNCENLLKRVLESMKNIMDLLESDFVAEIINEFIKSVFVKKTVEYEDNSLMHILSTYLLSANNKEAVLERCEKVLVPLIENSLPLWEVVHKEKYYIRANFEKVLRDLGDDFESYIFTKNMTIPVKVFDYILEELEKNIPIIENYVALRSWKLAATLVRVLEKHKPAKSNNVDSDPVELNRQWIAEHEKESFEIYLNVAPEFGKLCLEHLIKDVGLYSPLIHKLYAKALNLVVDSFLLGQQFILETSKYILNENVPESYLLVMNIFPRYPDTLDRIKERVIEIRKLLYLHPSAEVKMHYHDKFDEPLVGVEITNEVKSEDAS